MMSRKPYEKPQIIYTEEIESIAGGACALADTTACPTGPILSSP